MSKTVRNLVNYLVDKGFPMENIIYSTDVNENHKIPPLYDSSLFDAVIVYHKKIITELYVIEPDEKKLKKIKTFSKHPKNKEILIFSVSFTENNCEYKLISNNAVKSVSEYIKKIHYFELEKGCRRFFRGQKSIAFNLLPSLYRESKRFHTKERKDGSIKKVYRDFVEYEKELYNEAITSCSEFISPENTVFENLVLFQHYEYPTRLLDITSNCLVALYFAATNEKEIDGEVYIFDVKRNQVQYSNSKEVNDYSKIYKQKKISNRNKYNNQLFVSPPQNIERLKRQHGYFILFGCFSDSETHPDMQLEFRRIIIDQDFKKKMKEELVMCGIDEIFLFPDLQTKLNYIKNNMTKCF